MGQRLIAHLFLGHCATNNERFGKMLLYFPPKSSLAKQVVLSWMSLPHSLISPYSHSHCSSLTSCFAACIEAVSKSLTGTGAVVQHPWK